jgi:cytochrome c peroxidase
VVGALVCAALVMTIGRTPGAVDALAPTEPIAPIPPAAQQDPARVTLGERLFHDARLSREGTRSCATCHPLDAAGMDGLRRGVAVEGDQRLRNTPTVFNVAFGFFFNWDGAADSLERHAEMVLLNPDLMNMTWPDLLGKLRADPGYVSAFGHAYPEGLARSSVLNALASFERSLQTPDSPFDRYLRGDAGALTTAEQRGYQLFKAYGCVTCHQGINVGGNMFQRFGIFLEPADRPAAKPDLGRFQVTGAPRDRGVFRVPSLRNVEVTGPYFHDGRAATLETAVDTMARVQLGRTLSADDIHLLVQFLRTLTGDYRGARLTSPRSASAAAGR